MAHEDTVAYLVDQTLDYLEGSHTPVLNQLDGTLSDSATSVVTKHDFPSNLGAASIIQIGSELMYVLDADTATNTLTVIRGYKRTLQSSHSDAAIIEFNPRFPRKRVLDTIRDEILSWPSSLFRIVETTTTISKTDYDTVDITDTTFLRVLRVEYTNEPGNAPINSIHPAKADSSGDRKVTIRTYPRSHHREGRLTDLTVLYAAHFLVGNLTEDDDLAGVGIDRQMVDIPYLGAAYRLLARDESKNTNTQVHRKQRQEESVQVGMTIQTSGQVKALRDQRIKEESGRLKERFPPIATHSSAINPRFTRAN